MMKRLLSVGALAGLLATGAFAQEQHRECATMDHHHAQLENNPEYAENLAHIEEHTNRVLKNQFQSRAEVTGVITIPVVVHVVYNNSTENISDAQINDQIRIINEDFRATNSDFNQVPALFAGRAADSEFEFVLDQIVRVSTSRTSFSSNDAMKSSSTGGSNAIDPSTKLNMWVCDLSGGLLGYAQFPGGALSTDGVVMDYQYFGSIGTATAPFDKGRTTTHEIGHWLNLRHIWGDGGCSVDDFVSDTPVMGGSNGGCPSFGINSCNEGSGDEPDMWMNYMDYMNDACMYMFTEGQKSRMRAIFEPG
ncbi:MAG TPA: zinc metalloprotease, partial [Cytophagales bacterium]|nr:zinc metalloprotease [Cytophagales bacterium]